MNNKKEMIDKKLEALDSIFGLLNDLTLEQRKRFDDSVSRKPMVKK